MGNNQAVDSAVPLFPYSFWTAGEDQWKLLLNLASVSSYCLTEVAMPEESVSHSRGKALLNEHMQTKCRNPEWTLLTIAPFPQ